ncbi:hypothetical protein GY45DRAFT_112376 [Cubamyces sp. BRFM 1775]|nr:hypothetical protein GY45DRAFT_112376 [Cubamyces sp. BRFM 1775]
MPDANTRSYLSQGRADAAEVSGARRVASRWGLFARSVLPRARGRGTVRPRQGLCLCLCHCLVSDPRSSRASRMCPARPRIWHEPATRPLHACWSPKGRSSTLAPFPGLRGRCSLQHRPTAHPEHTTPTTTAASTTTAIAKGSGPSHHHLLNTTSHPDLSCPPPCPVPLHTLAFVMFHRFLDSSHSSLPLISHLSRSLSISFISLSLSLSRLCHASRPQPHPALVAVALPTPFCPVAVVFPLPLSPFVPSLPLLPVRCRGRAAKRGGAYYNSS